MEQEFVTLPREVVEQALEAWARGCPPDCKDGMTDSGGVHPWGEAALIECPSCQAVEALRAALDQPQNHVPEAGNMAPAGWKLVPVEPNCSMVLAGERSLEQHDFLRLDSAYRAMLAAAPQPPAVEQPTGGVREAFEAWCHLVGLMQQSHGIVSINSHTDTAWLAWQAAIANGQQPQANQPAMTPIAQRKLDSLLTDGYAISGYSVYHERKHQHGFVTNAGLVGWWKSGGMEYPQPLGEPSTVAFCHVGDVVVCDNDSLLRQLGVKRSDKLYLHPQDLNCKSKQALLATLWGYTKEQPKRPPLTDNQIDKIAESMPGGLEGFLKGWGWRQFARAVLENDHNIK